MALTDCPSPAQLNALLQGHLDTEQAVELEDHVGACSRCQKTVDALVGDLPLTKAIREAPSAGCEIPNELVARLGDLAAQFTHVKWPDGEARSERDQNSCETDGLTPAGATGRLGPYRVIKLLGAGGMGLVYLAEDTGLKRAVALKLLRPHLVRHPKARDGFLREARAMASLKHDNVVTVFQVSESATDDAVPYLAMELLEGESLSDWLRRAGPMPVTWVARLGRQAAEGLAAAHARGVLHRDIKPGNLWLEAPAGWVDLPADQRPPLASVGRLKILDFGLAQQVGADGDESAGFGTPAYLPPEHVRGEPLTPSADLFGLGVVLYEMTTGRLPFATSARSGIPIYAPPTDLRAHAPDAPTGFAELVENLLRLKPHKRPASARDVATRLAELAELSTAETSKIASRATVPVRRAKITRRRRTVIGVLVLALVAGGLYLTALAVRGPVPPAPDTRLSRPPDEEWCRLVGELSAERQFATVIDKLRELNPGFNGQATVQIADGEVRSLSILTDQVRDIRPIRALARLRRLECNGSARDRGQLVDLSPIRGLPLTELNCWWNRDLRDMSPVRGLALKASQFGEIPVEDLSPFAGMPLTSLAVNGCPVRTVEIVRTLPQLRFLNCIGCPIETLEPLKGSSLQHLAFSFQQSRGDAEVLQQLPRLQQINWVSVQAFRKTKQIPEPGQ